MLKPRRKKYYPQLSDATKHFNQVDTNTKDIATLKSAAPVAPGGGTPTIENRYADLATMFGDQGNQTDQAKQFVTDASADATVDAGWAEYEYLGTTVGDITDYRKSAEGEGLDAAGASTVVGEPTGSGVIPNTVWITQADYDTAVAALTTVATTLYIISDA